MSNTFLSPEEIREATDRIQHRAQAKVLRSMGIVFKVRADGSILVLRSHFEAQLGGKATSEAKAKEFKPNWDAANA